MIVPERLTLRVKFSELDRLAESVSHLGQDAGLDGETAYMLDLALTEAFTNIVKHGFPGERPDEAVVEAELEIKDGEFTCLLRDRGIEYEPDKAITSKEGLGFKVIARIMDEVYYERAEDTNMLRLSKLVV